MNLKDFKLSEEQKNLLIPIIGMYEETIDSLQLYSRRKKAIEALVKAAFGLSYPEFYYLFVPNRLSEYDEFSLSDELSEMPKE